MVVDTKFNTVDHVIAFVFGFVCETTNVCDTLFFEFLTERSFQDIVSSSEIA